MNEPFEEDEFNPFLEDLSLIPVTPQPREDLVRTYGMIARSLGINPRVIYSPCCSDDVSPSAAFPTASVRYVEIEDRFVNALQEKGFNASKASAIDFIIEGGVDLLILLNSTIPSSGPAANVNPGGIVICNNYSWNASEILEDDDFELVGVTIGENFILEQKLLEPYSTTIDTDDELQRIFPKIKHIIDKIIPGEGDLVKGFGTLVMKAIEQAREKAISLELDFVLDHSLFIDVDDDSFFIGDRLPMKKNNANFYIFRRKIM